ncbi:MAG TPA: hypothetical protein VGF21_01245 [Thermoleophilaceae bacterium]
MDKKSPHELTGPDLERRDGSRILVWNRKGRLRLAVVGSSLALAAAGVAGCGTGGDSQVASVGGQAGPNQQGQAPGQGQVPGQGAQGQPTADQQAQFKKFRDCMKKHGVDLPDFSNGPPQGGPPSGFDPTSSKFRSAIQACSKYRPQGVGPGSGGGPPGGDGPPGVGGPPGMGYQGSGAPGAPGNSGSGSGGSQAPAPGSVQTGQS